MKKYRYIGTDPMLVGQTALGRFTKHRNRFVVQVDFIHHVWSHGWHRTPLSDWKLFVS